MAVSGLRRCRSIAVLNKILAGHASPRAPVSLQLSRCMGSITAPAPVSQSEGTRTVTLIPGDGVWPELIEVSVKDTFAYIGVPVQFEEQFISDISPRQSKTLNEVLESVRRNTICVKGILKNPATGLQASLNLQLRKNLDAFANVVLVRSLPGLTTRYSNLDFIVIREQTEGEYTHLEHESVPGVVESLKVVTAEKSRKIAKFAFDYATKYGRKKVTAVHKANIMKLSDGLFLESCREISELYPSIKFESMIVDNTCMQLVSNPHQFDVMVMPNLYGSIVDNVSASLVGGAGVVPGATYGRDVAFFEPGARHSFADAQGRDVANPTAILLSAAQMLNHMHLETYGKQIENAVYKVIKAGKVRTRDMGGYATTSAYMKAIFSAL